MSCRIIDLVRRELAVLRKHPIILAGTFGVVVFCCVFFLTFFNKGLPEKVPIGIVDMDQSYMSREIVRQIGATRIGQSVHYDSFEEAHLAMGRGEVCGICLLPSGLYSGVNANRRPTVSYYLNTLYYVGGSLAYKELVQVMNVVGGGVQRKILYAKGFTEKAAMDMIQPVAIDTHQIGNAYTNYGYYITNVMLPGLFGMVIIIALIYALGIELKNRKSRELLDMAGGSITRALAGKLIEMTVIFCTLGIIIVELLYRWMHFPIAGSIWNMHLGMFLFILASEAIAIFLIGCLPIPRLALSVGALYSVLGLTLSGFTLPLEAMPVWFQGPAQIFPLRHYFMFYTQEVIFGTGFAGWYKFAIYMLLFLLAPLPLLPRLKKAYKNQNFPID